MKTTKTFYTVTYKVWGTNGKSTATFDNKLDAKNFASRDYTDKPVRHTLSDQRKIASFENSVAETKCIFA